MNERAATADRRKSATNISLDRVLKKAAREFCKDHNVNISELAGNFLERKLIEAGYVEKTDTGFRVLKFASTSTPEAAK